MFVPFAGENDVDDNATAELISVQDEIVAEYVSFGLCVATGGDRLLPTFDGSPAFNHLAYKDTSVQPSF